MEMLSATAQINIMHHNGRGSKCVDKTSDFVVVRVIKLQLHFGKFTLLQKEKTVKQM